MVTDLVDTIWIGGQMAVVRLYWPLNISITDGDSVLLTADFIKVAHRSGSKDSDDKGSTSCILDILVKGYAHGLTDTAYSPSQILWKASPDSGMQPSQDRKPAPSGPLTRTGKARQLEAQGRRDGEPRVDGTTLMLCGVMKLSTLRVGRRATEAPVCCVEGKGSSGRRLPLRVLCYDPGTWRIPRAIECNSGPQTASCNPISSTAGFTGPPHSRDQAVHRLGMIESYLSPRWPVTMTQRPSPSSSSPRHWMANVWFSFESGKLLLSVIFRTSILSRVAATCCWFHCCPTETFSTSEHL